MSEKEPKDERRISEEDAATVSGGTDLVPETDGLPDAELHWSNNSTPVIYSIYIPELYPDYELEYPSGLTPKDEFDDFDLPY